MNKSFVLVLSIALNLFTSTTFASPQRDYYAEPGLQPFDNQINQSISEFIDPFGGTLQLKYRDIVVPGNGGLDIVINRVYTSPQDEATLEYSEMGLGWTIHFGRIVASSQVVNTNKICTAGSANTTADNPSLELPDGRREVLVAVAGQRYLITKSFWKAKCLGGTNQGMLVTAPDGTRYTMNVKSLDVAATRTSNGIVSFYTSKIQDLRGNVLQFIYNDQFDAYRFLKKITASDGRVVNFTYLDPNRPTMRLASIEVVNGAGTSGNGGSGTGSGSGIGGGSNPGGGTGLNPGGSGGNSSGIGAAPGSGGGSGNSSGIGAAPGSGGGSGNSSGVGAAPSSGGGSGIGGTPSSGGGGSGIGGAPSSGGGGGGSGIGGAPSSGGGGSGIGGGSKGSGGLGGSSSPTKRRGGINSGGKKRSGGLGDAGSILNSINQFFNNVSLVSRATAAGIGGGGSINQIWRYRYTSVNGISGNYYYLTQVIRPDNLSWVYSYNDFVRPSKLAGVNALKSVSYPYGGVINYTYQNLQFGRFKRKTTVVKNKLTSGRNVTRGQWNFNYLSGVNGGLDQTIVTAPDKSIYEYNYYGTQAYFSYSAPGQAWKIGLLLEKKISRFGLVKQQELYTYSPRKISSEAYTHGRNIQDRDTNLALISKQVIVRDGTAYETRYENYDRYGNAQRIIETGNIPGNFNKQKITDYRFSFNTVNWLLHLKTREQVVGDTDFISYLYWNNGLLRSENKYGVATRYNYYPTGDLKSVTDARGYVTSFDANYMRGAAQRQKVKVNKNGKFIVTSRLINPSGTVASATDGKGNITRFSYDNLNRLSSIIYPESNSAPVSISYSRYGKNLLRGTYLEAVTLDGFGNQIASKRRDTKTGSQITTTKRYDAFGRVSFASLPSSTAGTTTTYDALARPVTVTMPQNSAMLTYRYYRGNIIAITELDILVNRSNTTTYQYRSFGNPDAKSLWKVTSPENITTSYQRNKYDQVTAVTQGQGASVSSRRYSYNTKKFLVATTIDLESFNYTNDAIGNVIQKRARTLSGRQSQKAVQYSFDGLSRVTARSNLNCSTTNCTLIAGTSISKYYDDNSNISFLNNAVSRRSYVYDQNNNLTQESMTINNASYKTTYRLNNLDAVNSVTYPSGQNIFYDVDSFGRATKATPFVTNISYHPSGRMRSMSYANGQNTNVAENARSLISTIKISGVSNVANLNYAYYGIGNVKSITDTTNPSSNRTMFYDGVNRLIKANGAWGTGRISYDTVGNIKTKNIGTTNKSYSYNRNRLTLVTTGRVTTTYSYDENGNIRSKASNNGSNNWTYNYDVNNLLRSAIPQTRSVASFNYGYDGNDMRVLTREGRATTHYLYSAAGTMLGEVELSGNSTKTRKEYFYVGNNRVASTSNGVTSFFHHDALGSTIASTSNTGAIKWKEQYQPYGKRRLKQASGKDTLYTGKQHNDVTGLSYFGARWYDPEIGRFTGVDPIDFAENNIHSINRYAYANNNPYRNIDPNGQWAEDVLIGIPSLVLGGVSLYDNLSEGNYGWAVVDAVGMVVDVVAIAVPGIPGGAGLGIKASRVAKGVTNVPIIGKINPPNGSNKKMAEILKWGNGEAGAEKALIRGISKNQVKELKQLGYTKDHIQNWLKTYKHASINPKRKSSTVLTPVIRQRLMKNILKAWDR